MAASPGLEPRLTESESAVLPLDDEAIIQATLNIYAFLSDLSNGLLHIRAKKSPLVKLCFLCFNNKRERLILSQKQKDNYYEKTFKTYFKERNSGRFSRASETQFFL